MYGTQVDLIGAANPRTGVQCFYNEYEPSNYQTRQRSKYLKLLQT